MAAEGTPPHDERAGRRYGLGGAWWAWLIGLVVIAGIILWVILAAGDGDNLLVVPQQPAAVDVQEGDTVRVTGTVREFEFEEGFGDVDAFGDFEGVNAIVATSVEEVDAGEVRAEGPSIDDIPENDDLLGRQVTVVGEVEEDEIGVASFTVGELDD